MMKNSNLTGEALSMGFFLFFFKESLIGVKLTGN